jgi:hypothetical protein
MRQVQVVANNKTLFGTSKTKIDKIKMKGKYEGNHRFVLDPNWIDSLDSISYVLDDHCLACGSTEGLTKHHVVPRRVVKLYPAFLVTKLFTRNTVRLCHDCHDTFNRTMDYGGGDRTMSTRHWADKLQKFLDSRRKNNAGNTQCHSRNTSHPGGHV